MTLADLVSSFRDDHRVCIEHEAGSVSYDEFAKLIGEFRAQLPKNLNHAVIAGKNDLETFAVFIATQLEKCCTHVVSAFYFDDDKYLDFLARNFSSDAVFIRTNGKRLEFAKSGRSAPWEEQRHRAGFVIRTSGTSGKPYKLVLHDLDRFLTKFANRGPRFKKTVAFSPFDSIAGIETLFDCLVTRSILVLIPGGLSPKSVLDCIERSNVDCLQTTPTFINLMTLSGYLDHGGFRTLSRIHYGSEPSNARPLKLIKDRYPDIFLLHTYGMTETGILETETSPEDPTRFRLDQKINPGYVRGDRLFVKSPCLMLGYLNAEAKVEADGYLATNDVVEDVDGWWRVLGRADDTINLAGNKFYPIEVEERIRELEPVEDVTVRCFDHPIFGKYIEAEIRLRPDADSEGFRQELQEFIGRKLPKYMAPQKIRFTSEVNLPHRLKKQRK